MSLASTYDACGSSAAASAGPVRAELPDRLYFTAGRDPVRAFYIWDGGLGIWGAVALGAFGAWIRCRRRGIALPAFADALAPGLAVAQAIGRWGNYFNQELYGRATTLPWALRIDAAHRPADTPGVALYHPTFLYECLWNLAVAALVIWAERRFKLGGAGSSPSTSPPTPSAGPGSKLYWTSLIIFLAAVLYLWRGPRRTEIMLPGCSEPDGTRRPTAELPDEEGSLPR